MKLPDLTRGHVAALVAITGVFCSGVGMTVGAVIHDHAQLPPVVSATAPVTATRNGGSEPTPSPSQHTPSNADVSITAPTVRPSAPRSATAPQTL